MKKNTLKNYGFVAPVIDDTQHLLGSTLIPEREVFQEDGQWDDFLPVYEPQFNQFFDSYGCTVWGWENCIEIFTKRVFGYEPNFSERYIYILAGIRPPGADPHVVAEVIREKGLIDNEFLPMLDSYDDFLQPDPMLKVFLDAGKEFKEDFDFRHIWVFSSVLDTERRTKVLKENLKYSPICVSVTAWIEDNGVYVDDDLMNNHWCVIYGWTRKGWKVFDSYDQSKKIVSFDHRMVYAKGMYLRRKPITKSRLEVLIAKLLLAIQTLWQKN